MGSFLSEIISTLLDKDPQDETEVTYNKFVSSTVDTLKSGKASDEDLLQALRDIGAIMYIGALRLLCFIFFKRSGYTQDRPARSVSFGYYAPPLGGALRNDV